MADLKVRVQAHYTREELLPGLLERLAPLEAEVIMDDPAATIRSPWRTYLRCVSEPWTGTHLLVIQDDALPAVGFAGALERAIEARPDRVLCLFMHGIPPQIADRVRAGEPGSFVELHAMSFLPAVATVWPRAAADKLVRWGKGPSVSKTQRADDAVLWTFAKRHAGGALVTVPSIVEHPDEVPSVMRGRATNKPSWRKAARFADDATGITWS